MTSPQRRTVAEIAAPYANFLVPMPYLEPGVCEVCRCGVRGYRRCRKGGRERLGVGRGGADVVAMISLAPQRLAGGGRAQLSYELVHYKRPLTSSSLRGRFTLGLAAVLWTWLRRHEQCVRARPR